MKEISDKGLFALTIAAQILGIPADYEHLLYAMPSNNEETGVLRAAKSLGLKSKLVTTKMEHVYKMAFPVIAVMQDGGFVVVMRADKGKLLYFSDATMRPAVMTETDFQTGWTGEIILLQKKFKLQDLSKKFNLKWFLPVIVRFRYAFLQVFAASFFIQCFGLITPLFSQVIIDKVLVHKGLSTLDILVGGLFFINVFEFLLTILRNYIFSHTTNRVDVILGAKLFHHLLSLPLKYFEVRRIGDTVARVRELENIRQFLTGTSLTVVLDTMFTIFL